MRNHDRNTLIRSARLGAPMLGTVMAAVLSATCAPVMAELTLTPEQRATAFVAKMTLEEKAASGSIRPLPTPG